MTTNTTPFLHPLVFFENHVDYSARLLLNKHLKSLYKIGYRKLLLEFNNDLSVEQVTKELEGVVKTYPKGMPGYEADVELLKLFKTAPKIGFSIHHIDPYTRAQTIEILDDTNQLDASLAPRDAIMAHDVVSHANATNGGVIALVGYLHTTLANFISKSIEESPIHAQEPFYIIPRALDTITHQQYNDALQQGAWNDFRTHYYVLERFYDHHPEAQFDQDMYVLDIVQSRLSEAKNVFHQLAIEYKPMPYGIYDLTHPEVCVYTPPYDPTEFLIEL